MSTSAQRVAFVDFETTGLSARAGDRIIEVGVAVLEGDQIVDRYQSLVNPGIRIPFQIQRLTGISDAMIRPAPRPDHVMRELETFVGKMPLVAHNASFDSGFMDAEFSRAGRHRRQDFICSLRVARRIYPHAPNHKLGTLVSLTGVEAAARAHRALGDAEMTARVWGCMIQKVQQRHRLEAVPLELMASLQKTRIRGTDEAIKSWLARRS